jgi:hypothetical protein
VPRSLRTAGGPAHGLRRGRRATGLGCIPHASHAERRPLRASGLAGGLTTPRRRSRAAPRARPAAG